MGYQALLFCPDEKLARVVGQVFGEVEFGVETVTEPFVAVKKMMAQRYDAIVVDCTDEQNAALLFKSARNSSSNQGSLTIALVEGQAGVAKAYRIGANLVLTKPVNVEQAKGTLRVARGLLRKSSDAATATSHAATTGPEKAAPTFAAWPASPAGRVAEPVASAADYAQTPVIGALHSPMAAAAQTEEKPTAVPASAVETGTAIVAQPAVESAPLATTVVSQEPARTDAAKPLEMPKSLPIAAATSQSAAAAPARAKEHVASADREITEVKNKEVEQKTEADTLKKEKAPVIAPAVPPQADPSISAPSVAGNTMFAALGVEDAGASKRRNKLFVVAVAVLALAAAGYYGWTKFGAVHPNRVERPATPPAHQGTTPVSELAPLSTPGKSVSTGTTNRVSGATPATAAKPSAIQTDQSSATASPTVRTAANPEPEAKKTASVPMQVKSGSARVKDQTQAEEPTSQPPSPLTVATADDGLNGLVASPASSAQPVLARIRISQGVSQGLLIKRVQPKYPANALAGHAQGAVQIEATVDKEGKVVNPKVLSGDPILARAALEAVRQWRYKPYYLDGEPVEIQTQITINFKLN